MVVVLGVGGVDGSLGALVRVRTFFIGSLNVVDSLAFTGKITGDFIGGPAGGCDGVSRRAFFVGGGGGGGGGVFTPTGKRAFW